MSRIDEINEMLKKLEEEKADIEKVEKEKKLAEKDKRYDEVKKAYDIYIELRNKYVKDYGFFSIYSNDNRNINSVFDDMFRF